MNFDYTPEQELLRKAVRDFARRFKEMSSEQLRQLQEWVDGRWEEYSKKAAESKEQTVVR